jgi:hypothetical protein
MRVPRHNHEWNDQQRSCGSRQSCSASAQRRGQPMLSACPHDAPDNERGSQRFGISGEKEKTRRPDGCQRKRSERSRLRGVGSCQTKQPVKIEERPDGGNQQGRSRRIHNPTRCSNQSRIKRIENYGRWQVVAMLGDAQVPERIEALPNSEQGVMPASGRRQILGQRVAANQTWLGMENNSRDRGKGGIKEAQQHSHRQSDLPIRARLPPAFQLCRLPQNSATESTSTLRRVSVCLVQVYRVCVRTQPSLRDLDLSLHFSRR